MRTGSKQSLGAIRQVGATLLRELPCFRRLVTNLAAKVRGCNFEVSSMDASLDITGQRHSLYSPVWNLLQNAVKVTHIDTKERWPRKFGQSNKWLLCFTIQAEEPNIGAKA